MTIYNQAKTKVLKTVDLEKGYLVKDKRFVKSVPATSEVQEQSHWEVIAEYPETGGQDVVKVIDVPYSPAVEAHDEYEDIQVYIPYTADELLNKKQEELRAWRQDYFAVIDAAVWYDCLTEEEKAEVRAFRYALLDITTTLTKPTIPACVQARLEE